MRRCRQKRPIETARIKTLRSLNRSPDECEQNITERYGGIRTFADSPGIPRKRSSVSRPGPGSPIGRQPGAEGRAMKWVTREDAKVDRIACPWLIRRFVDKDAVFLYVPADQVLSVARREGANPYDVPGVELGHVDGRCSFESILHKYGLGNDPALVELAKIVHAADVEADIDSSPEGRGLQAIAKGFSILHGKNDHRKIELETPMYDALYAWCRERAKI